MEDKITQDFLVPNYQRAPVEFVSGNGAVLTDINGEKYLDALSGIAVCGLGHAHPELAEVLSDQASKLWHTSNLYRISLQEKLAESLVEITGLECVFFCNSGAEANEAAIKIARKAGSNKGIEKPKIVTMKGSFHGRTMGTLSATGNEKVHAGFSPLLPGFQYVDFNSIEKAEKAIEMPEVVAILVEPIQGEGGVILPDRGYLTALRKTCDDTGTLLMLDEVQTGMGRTGNWFAYQKEEILPDVLTVAKGLGNGIPMGACLAKGLAGNVLQPGSHGSTFGGNPLVAAVALKVLEIIERDNLIKRAEELGDSLRQTFQSQIGGLEGVKEIRGEGLMIGIELEEPCPDIVTLALQDKLLVNVAAGNVIRLLPPLILRNSEADILTSKLSRIIRKFLAK